MNRQTSPDMGIVDYSRQEQMDANMSGIRGDGVNVIVGCGGVGFWVGLFLAMNGYQKFVLMDGQTIDNSNLNRLPVPLRWIGLNKAFALRRIIRTLRPDCHVVVIPAHVTANTLGLIDRSVVDGYACIWDCTDDAKIQTLIYKKVQEIQQRVSRVVYRKLGYEGFKMGTYTNFDIWFTDEANYQPGYRTTSANAMSSAMTAVIGIFAQGLRMQGDVKVDMQSMVLNGGNMAYETNTNNEEDDE